MKNKKIVCFISNLSFKDEPTVENRLLPYITQTLKAGHKVVLISRDVKPIDTLNSPDFTHKYFPDNSTRPHGFIARALHENKNTRELLLLAKELPVDIYMLTIPSMFLLFNAKLLKGSRLFLDVRDLTWHYLSKSNVVHRVACIFFEFFASRTYKYFENIAVTNETERSYFSSKSISSLLNFNGISQSQFNQLCTIKPVSLNAELVVSYVGKVGVAQNLDLIIGVAKRLPNVKFNIVGYGPLYGEFKSKVESNQLKNVYLPGSASWEKVLEYYQNSDILYAQLTSDYSGAMPSKLYQYLCASRYVIYGGEGQARSTLGLFSNNTVVSPDSVDELVTAIHNYQNSIIDLNGYENNLTKLKQYYIRELNVDKLVVTF